MVVGAAYCKETFVATKEAPQTMTANRALRIAFIFILVMDRPGPEDLQLILNKFASFHTLILLDVLFHLSYGMAYDTDAWVPAGENLLSSGRLDHPQWTHFAKRLHSEYVLATLQHWKILDRLEPIHRRFFAYEY
jgi:hypothetical protein